MNLIMGMNKKLILKIIKPKLFGNKVTFQWKCFVFNNDCNGEIKITFLFNSLSESVLL